MPVGRGGGGHGRRKKYFFSALSRHAINPTTPTQRHFVLSPVSCASRDQDDGPVELNDRHLRSHGKIGDCEQSTRAFMATFSILFSYLQMVPRMYDPAGI